MIVEVLGGARGGPKPTEVTGLVGKGTERVTITVTWESHQSL